MVICTCTSRMRRRTRSRRSAGATSVHERLALPPTANGRPITVRDLLAHRAGLEVVPYTFRAENQFLYTEFRSSTDPNARGDMVGMIQPFLDAGIDGFFTDNPDLGVEAASGR